MRFRLHGAHRRSPMVHNDMEVIVPTIPSPSPVASLRLQSEIVCAGSHYDMGLAQGSQLKRKIHSAIEDCSKNEAFRIEQPWWLPHTAYVWLAEQRAKRLLSVPLPRDNPNLSGRL